MQSLSFDDVLLLPRFSQIKSRADVSLTQTVLGMEVKLPFISANMDSVTGPKMAKNMNENGALAALHRFCTIEENIKMFLESPENTIVSIGLGDKELQRAEALYQQGACNFLIDVAHGASMEVVKQFTNLRHSLKSHVNIIVGNFATREGISDFKYHCITGIYPDAYKVGIGGGSACLTRVVAGVGLPTLASILDCSKSGETIIADGGIRNSGDCVKALAAGADLIMCGRLFAGTDESPGEVYFSEIELASYYLDEKENKIYRGRNLKKKYRGSASQESYEVQNKVASHRAPEGDCYFVPYVGPVRNVLDNLSAGIRSGCSYLGANNLEQLRENAEFVEITTNGVKENGSHGKQ